MHDCKKPQERHREPPEKRTAFGNAHRSFRTEAQASRLARALQETAGAQQSPVPKHALTAPTGWF
eukprot:11719729-Alexandrium_andersonii.AAC.1